MSGASSLGGPAHKTTGSGGRGVSGKGSRPLGAASYAEARPASPQFTSTNSSLFNMNCIVVLTPCSLYGVCGSRTAVRSMRSDTALRLVSAAVIAFWKSGVSPETPVVSISMNCIVVVVSSQSLRLSQRLA